MAPSQVHEALSFYEGTWTNLQKDHADVVETCRWLQGGRRHILCTSRRPTAQGDLEAVGVYSYDARRKEYVYHGFGSRGGLAFEHGQRIPGGFRFFSEDGTGADRQRRRFTITEQADGKVGTLLEASKAGQAWRVVERIDYLRTRPTAPAPAAPGKP